MSLCKICKGNGHVTIKMKDRSGKKNDSLPILGICVCPSCDGNGTQKNENYNKIQSVEQYDQIVG